MYWKDSIVAWTKAYVSLILDYTSVDKMTTYYYTPRPPTSVEYVTRPTTALDYTDYPYQSVYKSDYTFQVIYTSNKTSNIFDQNMLSY